MRISQFLIALAVTVTPRAMHAQHLAVGTYQITGAGVDTSATHPATTLVLPFDMPQGMGSIQSGYLRITDNEVGPGQRWRLSWDVVLPGQTLSTNQYAEGRIDGSDAGNVHQLVQDAHAEAMAFVHQQGSTYYLVTSPSLRFKIVRQLGGMIRKAN